VSTTLNSKALKCAIAALLVLLTFVILRYNSLPSDDYNAARYRFHRNTIVFSSCGLAGLVCLSLGIVLLRAVRKSRIHPVVASLVFVPVAIGTVIVPALVAPLLAWMTLRSGLFSGDNGFILLQMMSWMVWISGPALVLFLFAVALLWASSKRKRQGLGA
jgi:ABC-type polysaccharide transport system permease subunit